MTELALIKLTRPETATDPQALISRMDRLERRMGKPEHQAPAPKAPAASPSPAPETGAQGPSEGQPEDELAKAAAPLVSEEPDEATDDKPPIDISFEQLQRIWPGLFGGLRDLLGARRWAFFREAVPGAVEGNTIILEVAHDFHLSSLEQDDAVAPIVAAKASDLLGGKVRVRFRLKQDHGSEESEDELDITQLEERPAANTDPASLLESELGAKVVDDV